MFTKESHLRLFDPDVSDFIGSLVYSFSPRCMYNTFHIKCVLFFSDFSILKISLIILCCRTVCMNASCVPVAVPLVPVTGGTRINTSALRSSCRLTGQCYCLMRIG